MRRCGRQHAPCTDPPAPPGPLAARTVHAPLLLFCAARVLQLGASPGGENESLGVLLSGLLGGRWHKGGGPRGWRRVCACGGKAAVAVARRTLSSLSPSAGPLFFLVAAALRFSALRPAFFLRCDLPSAMLAPPTWVLYAAAAPTDPAGRPGASTAAGRRAGAQEPQRATCMGLARAAGAPCAASGASAGGEVRLRGRIGVQRARAGRGGCCARWGGAPRSQQQLAGQRAYPSRPLHPAAHVQGTWRGFVGRQSSAPPCAAQPDAAGGTLAALLDSHRE